LDPGGSYYGEGGALRHHSSANRGIFVRFLFENKTLPTTPGANKKREGCDALSGLVSFVYSVYVAYDECLNFSLPSEETVFDRSFRLTREIFTLYSIMNDL